MGRWVMLVLPVLASVPWWSVGRSREQRLRKLGTVPTAGRHRERQGPRFVTITALESLDGRYVAAGLG
jgi:hypothetical protein